MTLFLDCHARWDTVGLYDADTWTLTEFDRANPRFAARQPDHPNGHYASLGGEIVVLFRLDPRSPLTLRVGGHERHLNNGQNPIAWKRRGRRAKLTLKESETDSRYSVTYRVEPRPKYDPTPFVESEDWDFGEFISNLGSNPQRSAQVYRPDSW